MPQRLCSALNHLLGWSLVYQGTHERVLSRYGCAFSIMMNAYLNADELKGMPQLEEASCAAVVSGMSEVVEADYARPFVILLPWHYCIY